LYDLLAFRALDYFSNDEKDVTPGHTFELKDIVISLCRSNSAR